MVGDITSLKNLRDPIGNQTRNFSTCSAVLVERTPFYSFTLLLLLLLPIIGIQEVQRPT